LALIALFVYIEHHSREPMIPLGIFSSRSFSVANVYTLLLYAALGAGMFFVPFNLINVQHYSPLAAGAALLPMVVLMFVSSRWSGALVSRIGARLPLTAGAIAAGCGFIAMGFTGIGGSYWTTFFPAVLLLGIGTSTFVAPLTTLVMNSAPAEHAGSASGINNAVSRVAGLLAIALLGIVIAVSSHQAVQHTDRRLPPAARQVLETHSLVSGSIASGAIDARERPAAEHAVRLAYITGFRNAMLSCAALAWISATTAFTLLRR
jgi:predicted MFS family arabinose efflux permease